MSGPGRCSGRAYVHSIHPVITLVFLSTDATFYHLQTIVCLGVTMHGPGLFSLARLTTLVFSVLVALSSGSNYVRSRSFHIGNLLTISYE